MPVRFVDVMQRIRTTKRQVALQGEKIIDAASSAVVSIRQEERLVDCEGTGREQQMKSS